jgi:hypothetical protein
LTVELPTEANPAVLIHGDCLDVLRRLPDESLDHVITDPPYGEKIHAGARGFVGTGRCSRLGFAEGEGTRRIIGFDSIGADEFCAMAAELVRVSRRWVVMTCDWRHAAAAEAAGLPVVRTGVWIKPDAAPQFTGDRPGVGWEAVLILHRPGRKRWNGGGSHAVWKCGRDRNNFHPTVKPLALVREWVRLFTDPGESVGDPYMGSGTTGAGFIGCEIDAGHYATARRRIDDARGVGGLFCPERSAEPAGLFA